MIILGAGFSKAAGLPLAGELFPLILREAAKVGLPHILQADIDSYLKLKSSIKGMAITVEQIDLESFVSYLDIEHFLFLQGSDTWSSEGNRSQILIRNLICKILHQAQTTMREKDWQLYDDFVSRLTPGDIIVTFNYDTLLESSLSRKNIPFRYLLNRLLSVDHAGGIVDSEAKEVIVLKMHGSINWFDVSRYSDEAEYFQGGQYFQNPSHPVFSNHQDFVPEKIAGSPYHADSPLNNVYFIKDIDKYLNRCQYVSHAPLIISPSYAKMAYLNPLREFWHGFNGAGYLNPEMMIIGFSFSRHDEYLLIPTVRAIDNFQKHNQTGGFGYKAANLKLIDFKQSVEEIGAFKAQLPFIDWAKTDAFWDGLTKEVIHNVFNTQPATDNTPHHDASAFEKD